MVGGLTWFPFLVVLLVTTDNIMIKVADCGIPLRFPNRISLAETWFSGNIIELELGTEAGSRTSSLDPIGLVRDENHSQFHVIDRELEELDRIPGKKRKVYDVIEVTRSYLQSYRTIIARINLVKGGCGEENDDVGLLVSKGPAWIPLILNCYIYSGEEGEEGGSSKLYARLSIGSDDFDEDGDFSLCDFESYLFFGTFASTPDLVRSSSKPALWLDCEYKITQGLGIFLDKGYRNGSRLSVTIERATEGQISPMLEGSPIAGLGRRYTAL